MNEPGSTNIPVTVTIIPPIGKLTPLTSPTVTMTTGGYVPVGANGTVSWTSTNVSSCVGLNPDNASSAFNGSQPTSGTFVQDNMTKGQHFFLTCTGTAGKGVGYAWINVTGTTTAPKLTSSAYDAIVGLSQALGLLGELIRQM